MIESIKPVGRPNRLKSKESKSSATGSQTETDIQNNIRVALSQYGIVIRQNTGNFKTDDGRRVVCGVKGLSDLLFIGSNGKCAFIEVKTDKGKATPEQLNFIAHVRKLGHRAGIARSVDDALKIIGEDNKA